MSITPIKVRIVKRPIIKARFVPQLPANLTGRTAIAVERNGSIYYLDLDYAKLFETTVFDPATTVVAILNADGTWNKTTIASLSTMIGADKPNLVAIANAATAADKLGYWSGDAQYSLTDFTAYMRSLLDDPDATTARATLGLVVGTDVQPHDAELDALAGLVSAADRLPYFTGPGAAALTVLTPFARTLLDDADAATMRATIDAQQHDTDLDAIAGLTPTNDDFIQRKAGAWVNRSIAQIKTDLAINNVDNTSDLDKPISTATQAALNAKANSADLATVATTGAYGDLSGRPVLGTAAATNVTDYATAAQGAKADSAVQPGALGALATKNQISVPGDISAAGTPSSSTYLRGDGVWAAGGGGGGGDLLAANNLSDLANADTALDNLGGTSVGKAVFTAADQAAAQAAIGAKVLAGHLYGMEMNWISGATIGFSAGECADSSATRYIKAASAIAEKYIHVAWAAGTVQGMLDAGAVADGTYHIFAIGKSTDPTAFDYLASTSPTAPIMPATWDLKRRIGSVIRSGGNILTFRQMGDEFLLAASVADVNSATQSTTAVAYTLTVPNGIKTHAIISSTSVGPGGSGTNYSVYISSPDQNDEASAAPSTAGAHTYGIGNFDVKTMALGGLYIRTGLARQIRARANAACSVFRIQTYGWIDTRGRLA